ncbi:cation:proton antiporter [Marinobacterium sediminicola]|uniref:Monovalent cation:H+ antiporter, CPA1 family n=1 Tax=Marinobacterium sediminicola TaxID=518898 RepID=A0ABY1S279_9GAMM|nr:cation:proton antiporter [Marinobacterium sediminicola]ULG68496.1 cation:proton antiporter [Marinobacterium sediminicola]SMR76710.1 monovalent cation:H+ antiporter, CPA1 family [Marinobacterium sediminicola]
MDALHPVAELVGIIFTLLLVALSIYQVSRSTKLPFTVLLVLTGIAITALGDSIPALQKAEAALSISPDLILFVFLPALIFESSYNLDARQLRRNAVPILSLAIPGLLLSTGLIGIIVWLALDLDLMASLLIGAILSATDPVAVIALFRQIGAPGRLSTLIEGESLLNDATALVLSKILLGVLAAGTLSSQALGNGVIDFIVLFAGGLLFGVLTGYLTGQLIGWLDSDPILEIGLTSVLAYLAFLIAEELLHVSGIMATLGAGLTLGTWGRLRIASSVRIYLEQFWGVLAFTANALLFLLLGMQVNLVELASAWHLLIWVIMALLASRALVIFGLLPLVGRLPGQDPIGLGYRFIMFWGGLRGAIALAIVLSLPDYPFKDLFIALVTGSVLFTLLVQGLTIKPAMRAMKLDQPPLADRLALIERDLMAHQRALQRLPALQKGGLFSSRIAHRLSLSSHHAIAKARQQINQLRQEQLTREQEFNLFFLRALAEEKAYYIEMYDQGHLSESTARRLLGILEQQTDSLRYDHGLHKVNQHRHYEYIEHWLFRLLGDNTPLHGLVERLRIAHIGHYYEMVWGHFQGSSHVIHSLEHLASLESTRPDIVNRVVAQYQHWNTLAVDKLHRLNNDFPEFALLTQERLSKRVVLLAELETTREQARLGTIPKGVAEEIEKDVDRRLNRLRGEPIQKLNDDPALLLARVPLFAQLPQRLIQQIAQKCEAITLEKHEHLIHQGSQNNSLYMVSRGSLRLEYHSDGAEHRFSTLIAGDSFGESALLGEGRPDLSVVAQTPTRLYTLSRSRLQHLMEQDEELRAHLQHSDDEQKQIHSNSGQ